MKICEKCKNEFKTSIFINGKRRNLQNRKYCLECSPFGNHNTKNLLRETLPESDVSDKKYYRWQKKARKARKRHLIENKGGKCTRCDFDECDNALEFHHRDPKTKKFALSKNNLLKKWESVLEEAKKCDLLCSNCHKIIHYEQGVLAEVV